MMQEFKDFLTEYKVIGLAATALVKSLVEDIIMPIVTPFVPGGGWQTATLALGPVVLKWGSFLSALINFLILALVVFLLAKMVLKEEKVAKK